MKRLIIFPYHPDVEIIMKYKRYLNDCRILGIISYKEDCELISKYNIDLGSGKATNSDLFQEADAVVLLDNYRDYKYDKYYQVMDEAIINGCEIIVSPLLLSQLDLSNYCGKFNILENTLHREKFESEYIRAKKQKITPKLHTVDVPIIGIMGMGKNCDKFETQLLFRYVLKEDYDVLSISSNPLGALFGYYTFPYELYDNREFTEKVILINHYISLITNLCDPDVVVLGIPEGVAPFECGENNHYAEYAHIIHSAVNVDMTVLCTYYVDKNTSADAISKMSKIVGQRFNTVIDAIVISKTLLEVPESDNEIIVYERLKESYLEKNYPVIQEQTLPIFINLFDQEKGKEAVRKCIQILEQNADAI